MKKLSAFNFLNFKDIKIPWLKTRKRFFLIVLIDSLIFLSTTLILDTKYNFSLSLFYKFLFIVNWIFISYVLGRYHNLNLSNNLKLIKSFFKTLISYIVSSLLLLLILIISEKSQNYNIKELFLISIICIPLSFFVQTIINIKLKEYDKNTKKWFYLGSSKTREQFSKNLSLSRVENKIINSSNINNLSKEDINNLKGFIIKDKSKIPNNIKNKFIYYNLKKLNILTVNEWCEEFLQRIPLNMINEIDLIRGEYSYIKKKLQIKFKRLGDIIFSFILLTASLPLILTSAILIKLEDGGNIFYEQKRTGLNGKLIKIYKLRSMIIDAEKKGVQWSNRNDKRVTKIGKFIRKTRIDELPQLLAVLKGEMSLIGPRPERPEIEKKLRQEIPFYDFRYSVKPGLSGWAQINYPYGASILDAENKLSYDLYYIKNFSTLLDFLILLKTVKLVLNAQGSLSKN